MTSHPLGRVDVVARQTLILLFSATSVLAPSLYHRDDVTTFLLQFKGFDRFSPAEAAEVLDSVRLSIQLCRPW
jgi:hypothetical protein